MFDLGSGPALLTSQQPIAAGSDALHVVEFAHNGAEAYLTTSGQGTVYNTSQGGLSSLNSQSSLYVGGIDIESHLLPKDLTFTGPFVG